MFLWNGDFEKEKNKLIFSSDQSYEYIFLNDLESSSDLFRAAGLKANEAIERFMDDIFLF